MTTDAQIKEISPHSRHTWLALVAGLFCLSGIWFVLPIENWLKPLVDFIEASPIAGVIAFGCAYVVTSLVLIPSTLLTLLAGSVWGFWWGSLWLHLVSLVADVLMFLIARKGFSNFQLSQHHAALDKLDHAFREHGFTLAVLLRWFPFLPTNVMNYLLGTTPLSLRDYFWATALGTIPNTLVFVYIGALGTPESRASVSDNPIMLGTWLALALISTCGLMFYARGVIVQRFLAPDNAPKSKPDSLYRGLHYKMYSRIEEVPQLVWEQQNHLFLTREYLQAMSAKDDQVAWHYLVLFDNEVVVGFAPLQLLEIDARQHLKSLDPAQASGRFSAIQRQVVAAFFNLFNRRVLVLGNSYASGIPCWWLALELDASKAQTTLLNILKKEARRLKAANVMLKDINVPLTRELAESQGYYAFDVDPLMELKIEADWQNLDDYLGAMKSKYRSAFQKVRQAATAIERRNLSLREVRQHQQRFAELYKNVTDNAGFCPVVLDPEAFMQQKAELGASYQVIGYFNEGRLVAFNTHYLTQGTLYSHFFGIEPAAKADFDLYRNILLDDIEAAIVEGCFCVHFGRSAQAMKSGFGASASGDISWLRSASWLNQSLFKIALRFASAPSWPQRNPFKDNPACKK